MQSAEMRAGTALKWHPKPARCSVMQGMGVCFSRCHTCLECCEVVEDLALHVHMHSEQPVHQLGEASVGALRISNQVPDRTIQVRGSAAYLCIGTIRSERREWFRIFDPRASCCRIWTDVEHSLFPGAQISRHCWGDGLSRAHLRAKVLVE